MSRHTRGPDHAGWPHWSTIRAHPPFCIAKISQVSIGRGLQTRPFRLARASASRDVHLAKEEGAISEVAGWYAGGLGSRELARRLAGKYAAKTSCLSAAGQLT